MSNQFTALDGTVPAVIGDRVRVEPALLELRRLSLADDAMGGIVCDPAQYPRSPKVPTRS